MKANTKEKPTEPTAGELLAASYQEMLGVCQKLYDFGGDLAIGEIVGRAKRALELARD